LLSQLRTQLELDFQRSPCNNLTRDAIMTSCSTEAATVISRMEKIGPLSLLQSFRQIPVIHSPPRGVSRVISQCMASPSLRARLMTHSGHFDHI